MIKPATIHIISTDWITCVAKMDDGTACEGRIRRDRGKIETDSYRVTYGHCVRCGARYRLNEIKQGREV